MPLVRRQCPGSRRIYCSVFENSRIVSENPKVVHFELTGSKFIRLNRRPHFTFNEAVSFVIECKTQEEIDFNWDALSRGGKESMCSWLKDRFGVSCQVVPLILQELLNDSEKSGKVMDTFMHVRKFSFGEIKKFLSPS